MRRFKGAKKEFIGLKVDLMKYYFVSIIFWYLRGNIMNDRYSISIARGRKGNKRWFKVAQKEFRWFLSASLFSPDKY